MDEQEIEQALKEHEELYEFMIANMSDDKIKGLNRLLELEGLLQAEDGR